MYADFYRLSTLPFQLTPDPRFFFGSSVHSRALAHLTYGIGQGEGFIIITGEVGAGKTTMVGHLLATLNPDEIVAAKIVTTQLNADDMLRMVCSAYGSEAEGVDKASLLRRLETLLTSFHREGKHALLVVDEAQNLSVPTLEELRMLSNFQIEGRTPLQCFLLGQPQFRTLLASKDLDQLRQRVIASYHLGPLNERETRDYIEHRLKLADWQNDPVFTDDAFSAIYEHTGGVPRIINTLCSRLLLYGFLEEIHRIDGAIVHQVAEEHEHETRQILDDGVGDLVEAVEAGPRPGEAQMGPITVKVPTNGPAPENTSMPANGSHVAGGVDRTELDDVLRRIDVLEDYVGLHERIIKKALRIAVQYLQGRRDDEHEPDAR